jgi:vanadium chloroperoxidase
MTATSPQFRFWIDMAMECVRRDHTPTLSMGDQKGPFLSARALGLALGALNDAATVPPGKALLGLPGPALAGQDLVLAAAAACHEVLKLRYPKQARYLDPAWTTWLALNNKTAGSPAELSGRAYGASVHALGGADANWALSDQYVQTGADYTHQRPAHEPMQHFSGGKWGGATPLRVGIIPGFSPPPGRVNANTVHPSPHFKDDFAVVKAKGAHDAGPAPNGRTPEEELIGTFWGYDGPPELGTPPRLYLQVVLEILDNLEARAPGKIGPSEELLLVAASAVAMADAGINAWHYKYAPTHMMWRPVVGIQKAPGNNGAPDPSWLPLGRPDTNGSGVSLTPDFPAYPSGHATFGAAAFELVRLFLVEKGAAAFNAQGVDNIAFDFVSDEFDGRNKDPQTGNPRAIITRGHASLWQAIVENAISRAYLGVHWFFDGLTKKGAGGKASFGIPDNPTELADIGGVWLGIQIAHELAPAIGVSPATIAASKTPTAPAGVPA